MVDSYDIFNIDQGLQKIEKSELQSFEESLDLTLNKLSLLKEENAFEDAKMIMNNEINTFLPVLAQTQENRFEAISKFEERLKHLNLGHNLSPNKSKILENQMINSLTDLKLKGISYDRQREINKNQVNESIKLDNLKASVLTYDFDSIDQAKKELIDHYNQKVSLDLMSEEEKNFNIDKINSTLFKVHVDRTISDIPKYEEELGRKETINILNNLRNNPQFNNIDDKTRININNYILEKQKERFDIALKLDIEDYNRSKKGFDVSKENFLNGFLSIKDVENKTGNVLFKVKSLIPDLKAEQKIKILKEVDEIKLKYAGMKALSENPDYLLYESPDRFIQDITGKKVLDKSSDEYLESLNLWQEFKENFGDFKTKEEINNFTDFSQIQKEGTFGLTNTLLRGAENISRNYLKSVKPELKNNLNFQKEYGDFINETLGKISIREAKLKDSSLTQEEQEKLYNKFSTLLDSGEYEESIKFLNVFLENGVDIFKGFEDKINSPRDLLKTHFNILGQIAKGFEGLEDSPKKQILFRNYTDFLKRISGQAGEKSRIQTNNVYEEIKDQLSVFFNENADDETKESLESLSSESFGSISFISSILANYAISSNIHNKIIANEFQVEELIEKEEGNFFGIYKSMLETSFKFGEDYYINNSSFMKGKIIDNHFIDKEGKIFDKNEVIPDDSKRARVHAHIYNSVKRKPFKLLNYNILGLKEYNPDITSMLYAILVEAGEGQIHSVSQLENIVFRNNTLFYKNPDGTENIIKVDGVPIVLNQNDIDDYGQALGGAQSTLSEAIRQYGKRVLAFGGPGITGKSLKSGTDYLSEKFESFKVFYDKITESNIRGYINGKRLFRGSLPKETYMRLIKISNSEELKSHVKTYNTNILPFVTDIKDIIKSKDLRESIDKARKDYLNAK